MLISTNWLGRHVDLSGVDLHELGLRFTMGVAELDGVHTVGHGLGDTVVIGHVREVHAIEGKRIRRTLVDCGAAHGGLRQIVCGAPNVAEGQRVAVALPGAVLGDLTIKEAAVGGVTSAGMICSEVELGIGADSDGIMVLDTDVAPGTPFSALCPLADTLFEIDNKSITHRPDLWGHRGVAREVAALLGRPLKPMPLEVAFTDDRPLTLKVESPEACPRYSAVTMNGLRVAKSPMWLRVLLHRVGTRPINTLVDATNFVMLDLGNPLHAFDRREVAGDTIIVRAARRDEAFTTLDGQQRTLSTSDLLIADANRGVALAGVMGGENSEIRDDTTSIVLESANFEPGGVRMTAQRLGLRTDSSARFEKGLDPRLVEDAARAFIRLVLELCPGARVTSAFMDVAEPFPATRTLSLSLTRLADRLGVDLGRDRVCGILSALSFGVEGDGDTLQVTVPSFRAGGDVGIPADLVEEIGRVYGYDNIEPVGPRVVLSRPHPNPRKRFERAARRYLSLSVGLDELQTYSFDFDPLLERIGAPTTERLLLRNHISAQMPGMRTSLVPNLLGVLEKNARNADELGVYEIGRVFSPRPAGEDIPPQPTHVAALAARVMPQGDPDASLFFALKGAVQGLSSAVGRAAVIVRQGGVDAVWAHPVRQAMVLLGDAPIGYIADVHPRTLHQLDVRHQAAVFALDLDALRTSTPAPPNYRPLARFPAVYRDFAVLVGGDVPASDVRAAIASADPALIDDVAFQSVYRGAGVADGQKSLAWSVTLRHDDRTLTEPEVRAAEAAIWASLAARVQGAPRA